MVVPTAFRIKTQLPLLRPWQGRVDEGCDRVNHDHAGVLGYDPSGRSRYQGNEVWKGQASVMIESCCLAIVLRVFSRISLVLAETGGPAYPFDSDRRHVLEAICS